MFLISQQDWESKWWLTNIKKMQKSFSRTVSCKVRNWPLFLGETLSIASVGYKQPKKKRPPLFKWALQSWTKSNSGDKLLCVPFNESPVQKSSLSAMVGHCFSQPRSPLLWRPWQPTGWPASFLPSQIRFLFCRCNSTHDSKWDTKYHFCVFWTLTV